MAQPTARGVHVDRVLTSMSVRYMQNPGIYIASRVFPIIPVDKQSDLYRVYTKNDWFRDEAQRRPPATESAGGGYTHATTSYRCDVWAFHKDVDDQTRANADSDIALDREASEFVTDRLLLRLERQWAADFFTTGVWGTDYTGVAASPTGSQFLQWNDDNADPFTDLERGKRAVLSVTGRMPNTLVLGYDVFTALKNHPVIRDRIKYTSDAVVTSQLLARYFEVERVFVAQAIYATNIEGETAAYSFIHGKAALLAHSAPNPGILTPSAGYTFAWRGISGNLGSTIGIKNFRMEEIESNRIEGQIAFDDKVVAADLGVFYSAAVA